ncbi:MAG TPA: hypothetical protein VMS99_15905 [Acidimicrobiia bacterium]|nr:hypothetical protein [Acidimicrobiia bacterium]
MSEFDAHHQFGDRAAIAMSSSSRINRQAAIDPGEGVPVVVGPETRPASPSPVASVLSVSVYLSVLGKDP